MLLAVPLPAQIAAVRHSYYVGAAGSRGGKGTAAAPWDLASALGSEHPEVRPGDTIWVRGGTYAGDFRSTLTGTARDPIVVRQAPGERAIIDGRLNAYGAYAIYWGFEVTQSRHSAGSQRGIDVRGRGLRFVNLTVHDAAGSGIGFWMEAVDAEIYGCIIYNNGSASSLDHGIYAINRTGRKAIVDNVVFDNFAYGIHVYGGAGQALAHVDIVGNVSFGNGSISERDRAKSNLIVGGSGIQATDILVADNVFYYGPGVRTPNVRLGYDRDIENGDARMLGNVVIGGSPVVDLTRWKDIRIERNLFSGEGVLVALETRPSLRFEWRGNTALAEVPEPWTLGGVRMTLPRWAEALGIGDASPGSVPRLGSPNIIIRRNRYDTRRAMIVVINPGGAPIVSADLAAVLHRGQRFELRNVHTPLGAPLMSGRYSGAAVDLPMRASAPSAVPGWGRIAPLPTAPYFDVLLLEILP